MDNKMISIGKDNAIPRSRIIAILFPDSSPVKKFISAAREQNRVVNATRGKKIRSAIIMDNGFIILSSVTPNTLAEHYEKD